MMQGSPAGHTFPENSREKFLALAFGGTLTLAYAMVLSITGGSTAAVLSLPLLAVLLFTQVSFRLALALLVIIMFMDFHLWRFNAAVLFTIPFGLSFLWNYRDIEWKRFANPLTIPILIYGICIIPSFAGAANPVFSLLFLLNVVAFLIVLYVVIATTRTPEDIRRILLMYLILAVLNSFVAFGEFVANGRRSFGFSGILFVDFAGLGITVTAAMALVLKGKARSLMFGLCTILAVALILTQTRGIWLTTIIALALMAAYAVIYPATFEYTRKRIVLHLTVGGFLLLGVSTVVIVANPYIERRATEFGAGTELAFEFTEHGLVPNSLVSRLLIWDTALNTFLENPVTGVGVYGFAESSREYSRLPTLYYRNFVQYLSPHQTFLAVLAETGIIGAVGFAVFFFSLIRIAFRSVREAASTRGKRYAFVCAMAVTYCGISMFVTDAWLWGRQIILLGIVAGLMVANRNMSGPTNGGAGLA